MHLKLMLSLKLKIFLDYVPHHLDCLMIQHLILNLFED